MAKRTMMTQAELEEEDQIRTGTFMGPSPGASVVNRTMERPRAGTMGIPATVPGMRNPVTGDLSVEARAELDQRSFRRTDPMSMTGIAEANPTPRGGTMPMPGRATTNPNARPVGRSPNDPTRIADQQRRRGNWAPAFQLGVAAMGQAQADQRWLMGQEMAQQQQQQMWQREDVVGEREHARTMDLRRFDAQQRADESDADFRRRMEVQRMEQEAGRITGTMMLPLPPVTPGGQSPGALPMLMTGDGNMKPMGGGPVMAPQAPQSGMMALPDGSSIMTINGQPVPEYGRFQQEALPGPTMPGQAAPARTTRVDGGARMEAPKIQTVPDPTDELGQRKIPVIWNPETGVFERVQNGDWIDDRTQSGAGAAAGGAVSAPRTTAGGNRFTVTPRA